MNTNEPLCSYYAGNLSGWATVGFSRGTDLESYCWASSGCGCKYSEWAYADFGQKKLSTSLRVGRGSNFFPIKTHYEMLMLMCAVEWDGWRRCSENPRLCYRSIEQERWVSVGKGLPQQEWYSWNVPNKHSVALWFSQLELKMSGGGSQVLVRFEFWGFSNVSAKFAVTIRDSDSSSEVINPEAGNCMICRNVWKMLKIRRRLVVPRAEDANIFWSVTFAGQIFLSGRWATEGE
jgi:hypothetical protein